MPERMNIEFLQESGYHKRKYRWLMFIEDVSDEGVRALPPSKFARPNLTFKEIECQHLNEIIYIASKPDWKPLVLTLYEPKCPRLHPVLQWIKKGYDPQTGRWRPMLEGLKKPEATLELYDGCGKRIERWKFEGVWPQVADFGELDMSSSDLVTCDVTLRYDRAYVYV